MDKNFIYGRIYSEIANGFSQETIDDKIYYFKHPTIAEHFSIYSNYEIILEQAKQKGLPTEEEKLKEAIEGGWWSSKKEAEITMLQTTIDNLIKTRNKLVLPSQKQSLNDQIKKNEAILLTYTKERRDILNFTAEEFAGQRFLDETVIVLTYSDQELLNRFFTSDDYYNLADNDVEKLRATHNQQMAVFNLLTLKRIAATGFFQNLLFLSEDAFNFWGKPASQCTKFQIDVLLYGKMYKNIIKNQAENDAPIQEEILNDAEKFVEWADNRSSGSSYSKQSRAKQGSNEVSSLVGATGSDLKELGVKIDKVRGKSLLDLVEENGGIMEKSEYLDARENN